MKKKSKSVFFNENSSSTTSFKQEFNLRKKIQQLEKELEKKNAKIELLESKLKSATNMQNQLQT